MGAPDIGITFQLFCRALRPSLAGWDVIAPIVKLTNLLQSACVFSMPSYQRWGPRLGRANPSCIHVLVVQQQSDFLQEPGIALCLRSETSCARKFKICQSVKLQGSIHLALVGWGGISMAIQGLFLCRTTNKNVLSSNPCW